MKRFFTKPSLIALQIVLCALLIGGAIVFYPSHIQAADPPACSCDQYPGAAPQGNLCVYPANHPERPGAAYPCAAGTGSLNSQQTNALPATEKGLACDSLVGGGFMCTIAKFFYYTVYVLFGTLLTIAAAFLDVVIKVTILQFANWIETVTGVRVAWVILRDVMNITFIFLLLYAAISMILGLGKEKGIVKGVILAGLLINFSFFFTSVIIDASNVVTVEMFEAIQRIGERSKGQTTDVTKPGTFSTADGITNVFMQGLGIQTQSPAGLSRNGEAVESRIFQQLVFSTIAILVIAFVFFAMAVLLLGRFIVLLILLITSPVSVMGGLFPQIAEHSKKWWKTLIEQVVFAPIMMLFMLVTVLIVSNPSFKTGLTIGESAVDVPFAGGIAGMINYAIVIGLLLTGMVVAKKSAGAASTGVSDWAIKKAQSMPGAVGGVIGRNTIAPLARSTGEKYDRAMGRMSQLTFKDAQGVSGVAKFVAGRTIAGIARKTPIDEGIRDTFKGVAASKFGSQVNLAEREKQLLERRKQLGQAVREADLEKDIQAGLDATARTIGTPAYDSSAKPIKEFLEAVGKLTDKKIEEMLADDLDRLKQDDFAAALTAKHMEAIDKSDLISETDKDDIRKARERGLSARIGAGAPTIVGGPYRPGTQAAEIQRVLSGKASEVAKMPAKVLTNASIAPYLSADVLRRIVSEGKMSDTDKSTIRTAIENAQARNITPNMSAAQINAANTVNKRLENAKNWLRGEAGFEF